MTLHYGTQVSSYATFDLVVDKDRSLSMTITTEGDGARRTRKVDGIFWSHLMKIS